MTCAKQIVKATIISLNGQKFEGTNYVLNPQKVCPRGDMRTGEGYELCKSICNQPAHAEINAINNAGDSASGATMIIEGHTYICNNCKQAADTAGIKKIIFSLNGGQNG